LIYLGDVSLKDLKDEVSQLRSEINRISDAIINERLGSVEKVLTSKHLNLYADQASRYVDEAVKRCVMSECSRNQQCSEMFQSIITGVIESVKSEDVEQVFARVLDELDRVQALVEKAEGKPCQACYMNLQGALITHRNDLQRISGVEPYLGVSRDVPVDWLVEQVLKPLSHPARLTILVTLGKGGASFSTLSEATRMSGGHLLFHLEQLKSAGLVAQDGKKGNYVVTPRGLNVINLLRSLSPN